MTACSTSRSAPTCGAGASAWRRTACRSARTIEDVRPDDVVDATSGMPATLSRSMGMEALAAGEVAVVTLAGGVGQPLDARGRRGEGAASLLPSWAASIAPSSKCTWPRAGASVACAARRCRTSSPPAI